MSLQRIRKEIDAIDRKILGALNERAAVCRKVGELKSKSGEEVYAPHREKEVLDKLKSLNRGPVSPEAIESIYREIMSFSISVEKKVKIAYLGPPVIYTHQAAQKKFGSSVEYMPCSGISDVFAEVERSRSDYGVVPVENSTEGAVNHTLDMFVDSDLKIYAEVYLPIHLHLMSNGNPLASITQVYSKNEVFGQCQIGRAHV